MALLSRKKAEPSGPPDGRKYRMGLLFAGLMLLGLALASKGIVPDELYSSFITGIGAIYFTYCSGNIGNKWVLGKHGALQARVGMPEEPPPPKEDPKEPPTGAP